MVTSDVLRVSYVVGSGGKLCERPGAAFLPLLHGMGQHIYLNVPEIR